MDIWLQCHKETLCFCLCVSESPEWNNICTSGGCQSETMVSTFIFLLNSRCCTEAETERCSAVTPAHVLSCERQRPESDTERSLTFLIIASDFRTLKLRAKKTNKSLWFKSQKTQLQSFPQFQQSVNHQKIKSVGLLCNINVYNKVICQQLVDEHPANKVSPFITHRGIKDEYEDDAL